ncbi:VOC family protein [Nocardia nova]|uniref:VOC family protein n=1 Tax=Nocardia nova TaxID=37330 RepID=UPI0033EA0E61
MVETSSWQSVFPNLKYVRPGAAITFLVAAFGFERHFVVTGEDGEVEHAQLRAGSDLIFISRDREDDRYGLHSPQVLEGGSQNLCVRVADDRLDEHQARARTAGARIVNPVHDSPAGVREYSCADPEQHVWTFSGYAGE